MLADKDFAKQSQARSGGRTEDRLLGAHSRIAEKLRAFYTEIQEEEIPSHLLNLLEKLDAAEASGAGITLPQAGRAAAGGGGKTAAKPPRQQRQNSARAKGGQNG